MHCARIKYKPVKFLDKHEQIVVELKDEIRRLRDENNRLRLNIVTAPSAYSSPKIQQAQREIDAIDYVERANSANEVNSRAHEINPFVGDYKHLKAVQVLKKPNKLLTRLKPLNDLGVRVPVHFINKSPSKESQVNRNKPKNLEAAFSHHQIDDNSIQPHEEEDSSHYTSKSNKVNKLQLEDVVRRRAVGPMIFKNAERDLVPLGDILQKQLVKKKVKREATEEISIPDKKENIILLTAFKDMKLNKSKYKYYFDSFCRFFNIDNILLVINNN
jgi:cell division septum initiation protein DivIVA